MKRTQWNEGLVACGEAAGRRNGEAEWTTARKAGGGKTTPRRQASFNVEFLHDTVWGGY